MTDYGVWTGELEIRASGRMLRGSMAYGQTATVANRGRVRKERLGPNAFGWQIREFQKLQQEMGAMVQATVDRARLELLQEQLERRNVHVLAGHSYDRPLGDLRRGTARVTSTDEALEFEVDLPDEQDQPTWMRDTVKAVLTNRAGGISPGFYIPPKDVVSNAEELIPEAGNPGVMIRLVNQGVMPEVSVVTRPVYVSEVDVRAEEWDAPTGHHEGRKVFLWL